MRWDTLRADDAGQARALFERGAVGRTFDTPGFRGMTFYEVNAKSIINRVPEASRVPFRWTINPYRGCSHACSYCQVGGTPILMADGRTKPLARVRIGDMIYGTIRDGSYRRYAITEVLAHWSTVKPAYVITLEDGTRLFSSGDHRFLTGCGWKHVTGTERGTAGRPHLTVNSKLIGAGKFAEPPKESAAYRRGYLCGMIRGDGHLGSYSYCRPDGRPGEVHRFRLALADQEALGRTRDYLGRVGIATTEFTFSGASGTRRQMKAIRTQAGSHLETINRLIGWPDTPTADWRKGFLAGLFDAGGSYSQGVWRISNTDTDIIRWTAVSMESLGFDIAIEPSGRPNGLVSIRLRGGLKEAVRFFHTTDPAITRKRSIAGAAIKSDARLGVVSIEPMGLDLEMFDITTGTGDFIADGVISHNCFARNTHTYLDLDAGHDFDSKIVVKVNAPALTRRELAAPRWQSEHIAMGTNVDCYQRAEGRYRLMPGIIGALRDAANPFSILTKGTLILRDVELLAEAAEVTDVGLNVSVGFTDAGLSRSVESGAPAPRRRLEVCAALTGRGLGCGVLMGPILPFLTDSPGQLEATVRQIAEAGATGVSPIVLHLRPGAREWFLRWLREEHPLLAPRYRALYGNGAYAPRAYQDQISSQVSELARRYRVGGTSPRRARAIPRRPPDRPAGPNPASRADAVQLRLLLPGPPPRSLGRSVPWPHVEWSAVRAHRADPGQPMTGRLIVRTELVADPGDLIAALPRPAALAWVRRGDGLVGWGVAAKLVIPAGDDRFTAGEKWLRELFDDADVRDQAGVPGSGPVAFGSFTFDPVSDGSVLVIPRVVLGRRVGQCWRTTIGDGGDPAEPAMPVGYPGEIRWHDGSLTAPRWAHAVAAAVARIRAGDLGKVVLARDLGATATSGIDVRMLLGRLAAGYPDCYAFSCAGLAGATPELLIRRSGADVTSLVLAGTAPRGPSRPADAALGQALLASAKDVEEHEYAADGVRAALTRLCSSINIEPTPSLLRLANVQHLATRVTGRLDDAGPPGSGTSALALAGALHPTAAVCGTPVSAAMELIRELEGMDRGRYAGPVGWVDARGNGEWGIALRCAEVNGRRARLFAGCGIVAESDPAAELAEAQAKFRPMQDALEG